MIRTPLITAISVISFLFPIAAFAQGTPPQSQQRPSGASTAQGSPHEISAARATDLWGLTVKNQHLVAFIPLSRIQKTPLGV
jgi:hypothetical protein